MVPYCGLVTIAKKTLVAAGSALLLTLVGGIATAQQGAPPARFQAPAVTKSSNIATIRQKGSRLTDSRPSHVQTADYQIPVNPLRPLNSGVMRDENVTPTSMQEFEEGDEIIMEMPENSQETVEESAEFNPAPSSVLGGRRSQQVQPMDDPFNDRANASRIKGESLQASPARMRSPRSEPGTTRPSRFYQDQEQTKGADGSAQDESGTDKGVPDQTTQDETENGKDVTRDKLPKQKPDRTIASNCSDIEAMVLANSINNISLQTQPVVTEKQEIPQRCELALIGDVGRCWSSQTVTWTASALCHKPLYFEDVMLERYGHTRGPILEHFRSGAHFFASVATLPYHMGIHPPSECSYALGYYRPGDCAPFLRPAFPFSAQGATTQALASVGLPFIIP
jgi:hypothetical protein